MNDALLMSMFLFILLNCRSITSFVIAVTVMLVYQYRFKRLKGYHYLCLLMIYAFSFSNFSVFDNCVLETHEKYVIASVNHRKVLIYTDEVYFENETVIVEGDPKEIESESNFNLFNFQAYMKQQNISVYYENATIIKGNSLKRRMYEKIVSMDSQISEMLLRIFYQFDVQDDFIYSSALHFSYLNRSFFRLFMKVFSESAASFLASIPLCLFGFLFPFRFAFLRIVIGNLAKTVLKKHSRKEKIGWQYLLCMLIYPKCVFSLSFLIPYFLNLLSVFCASSYRKKASWSLLMFLQFLKLGKCQPLSVLLFVFLQKINAAMLAAGLFQLVVPFSFIHVLKGFFQIISEISSLLLIRGAVPWWVLFLFVFLYFRSLHGKASFLICLLLLLTIPFQSYINPFYQVTMINVGQGDSLLIQAPFHLYNVLIDIPLNKEDTIIDYLASVGVHHIDTLVFTHDDSDHKGGKDAFIEKFKVKKIVEVHQDIEFIGGSLNSVNSSVYDNDNDNSIVYFGNIGRLSYCLMGDASRSVERNIINQYDFHCDILKVGHHGSKTSTDPLFIQMIQPDYAWISVAKNNRYGHPSEEVMEILKRYDIKTFLTSLHGGVRIKSFLIFHFLTTSAGEFDIMISE